MILERKQSSTMVLFLKVDSSIIAKLIWAQSSVIIAEQLSYPGDTVKRKLFMQVCRSER